MITDNLVQTFQLESSGLRGRIIRLGDVIDDILGRHDYPTGVKALAGEAAGLALLLSSMLKYEGVFTLQIQGDGPVPLVVADVTHSLDLRACARIRENASIVGHEDMGTLTGAGYLAFTVDQGDEMERYQGIVALDPRGLQESLLHYFAQSEQIATGVRFAIGRNAEGKWRAGGIILQRLPEQSGGVGGETHEDDWRRAMILLQSCSDNELMDPALSQNDLLFRLFHEEGVRIYDPVTVRDMCRCSPDRAENIVRMLSPDERREMEVDGSFVVTCEFCNRAYEFDSQAFDNLMETKE